ncbi:phosphoribosyltransferase-like protein [Bradyrhizobium oligotrophicum S58]
MKAAVGRLIFFDKLAEGLDTSFYHGIPRNLALSWSSQNVPASDMLSLARAICRQHAPNAENIPDLNWPWAGNIQSPIILNGCGNTLKNCVSEIDRIGLSEQNSILVLINFGDDATAWPRLQFDTRVHSDLIADAIDSLFSQCGRKTSTLARVRYEEHGFDALCAFDLFDDPIDQDWQTEEALDLYYHRISRSWTYRGYPVSTTTIRTWIRQFIKEGFSDEAHQLLLYLQQYGFVTETSVIEGLLREYINAKKSCGSRVVALSIQKPGKSEQKLAYRLKPFISLQTLSAALPAVRHGTINEPTYLFCFDDCIGSGESIEDYLFDAQLNPHGEQLVAALSESRAYLFIVAFHADVRAIARLEGLPAACGRLKVLASRTIDEAHRAFSPNSHVRIHESRRGEFMEFCRSIGERLMPGSPLGWGNCQWVVSYDYSIPDNSLPVLYGRSDGSFEWYPLFERAR